MTTPDPLYVALAAALTPHGPVTAAAIQAAAQAARRVLGTDRCTHDRVIHTQHHTTAVDGCPWCTTSSPADQPPTPPTATTVPLTGDHL